MRPKFAQTLKALPKVCKRLPICWKSNRVNRDARIKFAKEWRLQNQAYDFIAAEKLVGRFKTFCECHPTNLYIGLTGVDIMQDK